MVEHQILLMKLGAYGVANTPLSWFQSDLMNRQQVVSIDGSDSESCDEAWRPSGKYSGPVAVHSFYQRLASTFYLLKQIYSR